MKATRATFSIGVASVALLTACMHTGDKSQNAAMQLKAAAPAAMSGNCNDIAAKFKYDKVRIDSSVVVAAGSVAISGAPNAPKSSYTAPAHCLVKGVMDERKGTDGKNYAIGFEMRLPLQWNGRFYYQANGGLDGSVQVALGALGGGPLTGALHQGFAVISSDAGHAGNQNPSFGADAVARQNYGYGAVAKLTPMAKNIIATAYGKAPDRSYIGGCSNGGRHTMVAASRLTDHYDGYLVGAPGYRLPQAALAQVWGSGLWKDLAPETPLAASSLNHPFVPNLKLPDISLGFNAQDRQIVADAILAKCDALDGLKDGMVQDVAACQKAFDLMRDVPNCTAGRDGKCLGIVQKNTIAKVFAGGKTADGKPFYASFPYDIGVAGANWAAWKYQNSQALDPGALSFVFNSPLREVKAFAINYDELHKGIYAKPAGFSESSDDTMSPPGHDKPIYMRALQQRGAKMLTYHGVSDPVFSESDTRAWVDRVNQVVPNSSNVVRHFPVPGMNHCSGGPAADQFDALTPLVQWVEQGIAPQSIIASVRGAGNVGGVNAELPKSWTAKRTRPLCVYPAVAQYKGSGSLEEASSFSCK
ncbi:MAG TPA: tannase/feruloyl esterase family alpha/beta hydrolase [Burkholderiaceae bacterium]|nr:tannase/feruloyl esterase family alpha/beta hydrolase [Burkholderiaceae bacterium]